MRCPALGAGENLPIAIAGAGAGAGAGGMGRSRVEDGHVKNEQVVTSPRHRRSQPGIGRPGSMKAIKMERHARSAFEMARHGADGHGPAWQPRLTHR